MDRPIPEPVEMLRALVALPSVSSPDPRFDRSNRPLVDRLAEWAAALGFRVDVRSIPGDEGKVNLVATLGDGDEAGLMLAGHSDTVPYDEAAWASDPFELTEQDARLVGLGAADMKGFFAAALEAARGVDPAALRKPLVIVATADEESGMSGAKALASEGDLKADAVVVGEPTSLRPVAVHKGIAMAALRLEGRSGHSSDPALGVSALEGMYDGMDEVLRFRSELQRDHRDERFEVSVPTLNLGRIEGGDSPNRICPACELQFDLRSLPAMDAEVVLADLGRRLEARLEGSGLGVELRWIVDPIPGFETPTEAAIVREAERSTGASADAVMFATEGPYFRQLGIEAVVLGPGDIAVAHQPNEHVTRGELERAAVIYGALIERFCLSGAS